MILKLNKLLLTPTSLGKVWIALVDTLQPESGGWLTTGGFLITAFDTSGRVWISNQQPDGHGEGMQTTADKLERFLADKLFTLDGPTQRELSRVGLNTLVADFYRQEF